MKRLPHAEPEKALEWLDNIDLGKVWEVLVRTGRGLGTAVLAGILAGTLVGGVGGRLAMRITGILVGPEPGRILTNNNNVVGDITAPGTLGLILFIGLLLGPVGGLVYVAMRPWLVPFGRLPPLAFGLMLFATLGFTLITPVNTDFRRLGLPIVNVALFAAMYVLFGAILASLAPMLDRAVVNASLGRITMGRIGLTVAVAFALLLGFLFLLLSVAAAADALIRGPRPATGDPFDLRPGSLVIVGLLSAGAIARALPSRFAGVAILAIPASAGLALTATGIALILGPAR